MTRAACQRPTNHPGSLPSVGIYLDEQPITTIQGAGPPRVRPRRVETLSGPQGTLWRRLAVGHHPPDHQQARSVRPPPAAASSSTPVSHGRLGYVTEAFVNVPLSERSALRVVGWNKGRRLHRQRSVRARTRLGCRHRLRYRRQPRGRRDDYNLVDHRRAPRRAALRPDDNWTITPQFMAQKQIVNGAFATDPRVGDTRLTHF